VRATNRARRVFRDNSFWHTSGLMVSLIDVNRARAESANVDYSQIFQSIARFDSSAPQSHLARWSSAMITSGTERLCAIAIFRAGGREYTRTHTHIHLALIYDRKMQL